MYKITEKITTITGEIIATIDYTAITMIKVSETINMIHDRNRNLKMVQGVTYDVELTEI